MKKLTTKIISVILTLSIVLSMSVQAFASENYGRARDTINTQEDINAAREVYAALTPEAKAIFDQSLTFDPDMMKFHTTYIDTNFTPPVPTPQTRSAVAVADPMRVLMAQLGGLGLPSAVLYSFKAMGAGMVAAVADGPLPVGDIILAAATVSTVVVVAANWDKVSPVWNKVVASFQMAFATSAQNVLSAFNSLKNDASKKAAEKKVAIFNKSASDAVGKCDSNKQSHILQSKHNWNKFFKGPNWNNIGPILIKVLKDGKETSEGGNQYIKTLVYQGKTVVVRFIKDVDGIVKYISTAWVK